VQDQDVAPQDAIGDDPFSSPVPPPAPSVAANVDPGWRWCTVRCADGRGFGDSGGA
jgi:hypothetical protein